jgi:hypothetical protein
MQFERPPPREDHSRCTQGPRGPGGNHQLTQMGVLLLSVYSGYCGAHAAETQASRNGYQERLDDSLERCSCLVWQQKEAGITQCTSWLGK